jgi:thymidylate synthase
MKDIPVLHVEGDSLAESYEQALIALYKHGVRIKTQYDKEGDPPSIDATMNMTVHNPWSDPMIHKAFPGGIEDLREYVMELLGGKDHWVKNMDDKDDTRWEYTYHGRLADWGTWREAGDASGPDRKGAPGTGVNQIERVLEKFEEQPYTRQAQMITWMPFMDFDVYDPPCLQSIWYRLMKDDDSWVLATNVRFRSNDAWGANFMNMFGLTHFTKLLIAGPLEERLGEKVVLGRLNWQADSFHIYGKDQEEFTGRFWNRLESTAFDDRVFLFFDEAIQEIWEEAEVNIKEKIERYDSTRERKSSPEE